MSYGGSIAACKEKYSKGVTKPLAFRKKQLHGLLKLIQENEDEICEAVWKDLRRSKEDTVVSEVIMMNNEIVRALDNLDEWSQDEVQPKDWLQMMAKLYIRKEPYGVCLIISSWNYPVSLLINPLIAAIAAGNCAVLKPSEMAVHTADMMQKLLPKYIDHMCYPVVVLDGKESSEMLKNHRFDKIFFTGGTAIGRIIMRTAAEHLTPVVLELGGKNPCYVHSSSDVRKAAKRVCYGRFANAGQICLAPDYVMCDTSVKDRFVKEMQHWITEFYGQDPQKSDAYPRMINAAQFNRLNRLLESDKSCVAIGGETNADNKYIAPTVVVDVGLDSPYMREEMFGPILIVLGVHGVDNAIQITQQLEKPLALYVFSKSKPVIDKFVHNVQSGGVTINDCVMHYTAPTLPFGGVGSSGMGAYHGKHGFNTFTHLRACYDDGTPEALLDIRYPPITATKMSRIKRLMLNKPKSFGSSIAGWMLLALGGVLLAYAWNHFARFSK